MSLRVGARVAAVGLASLAFALPAVVVRLVTLGAFRPGAAIGSRLCSRWGRVSCRVLGVRLEVVGRLPTEPVFLAAANHLSYLDILVLASLYRSLFLAKREIAGWPVFGWLARAAGTLFVDRGARRDVPRVGAEIERCFEARVPLTLFPEGMATDGAAVRRFMPSLFEPAARLGVPCYGISLRYESSDPGIDPARHICWHDASPFLPHFARVASLRDLRVTVRFPDGPIVSGDRKDLARRVQEQVESGFRPVRRAEVAASCAR